MWRTDYSDSVKRQSSFAKASAFAEASADKSECELGGQIGGRGAKEKPAFASAVALKGYGGQARLRRTAFALV